MVQTGPPSPDHDTPNHERMTKTENTPARAGRERTCTQCGAIYRSLRNTSRYCSSACRKKANRGTVPTGGPKAGPEGFTIITKALQRVGYVGPIGSPNRRDTGPATYALLVPFEHALDELSFQFNRRGWGYVSRDEFASALKSDGIQGFTMRSPEAVDLNRRQTRRRMEKQRAA